MKIPKSHFARFRKEFLRCQELLGLTHYRIHFEHIYLPNDYAKITVQESAHVATVYLTTKIEKTDPVSERGYLNPEEHARHEVKHLLLYRLAWLGQQRIIGSDEIDHEEEAVCRRLDKILT